MKLLKDILYKAGMIELRGETGIAIEALYFDSRKVRRESAFIAIRGVETDGHLYIQKAIDQGAVAVICEEFPKDFQDGVTYVKVQDAHVAMANLAANFYDNPSRDLKLVGVTGTNGKTTTVSLLFELFKKLGYKVGLVSTIVNKIHLRDVPSTHTTPGPIQLNHLFRQMLNEGVEFCFMEVSSHAVDQKRIEGIEFTGGVFTNITQDHLDYHKTFKSYIAAKKQFFDELGSKAFALYNHDDPNGSVMVQNTKAKKFSMAIRSMADYKTKVLENHFEGLHLSIENKEMYTSLVGLFNAYNLMTVFAVGDLLGQDHLEMLTAISTLKAVEGRFQFQKSDNNIMVIVDYAHTPDAIKNVLKTIKDISTGNENIISVVGCGGDRDKDKRPKMAAIACELSNKVIFTSDNPRTESPEAIIEDMKKGVEPIHFKKTLSVTDRREAIKTACSLAMPGDIILIAGKGHEKYQDINGEKFPFDDQKTVNEILKMLEK
ncbi:MAG: UDP-N-acetylmuramoyl-L-alanyl-D-glutamate--2,6-diaminopimelate ligase [Patiriisocius sp.]|jgi:UDP-N-acetylmuramoyl-L-alanyl-D-glutamate--2,6-diaminopimelate ligase